MFLRCNQLCRNYQLQDWLVLLIFIDAWHYFLIFLLVFTIGICYKNSHCCFKMMLDANLIMLTSSKTRAVFHSITPSLLKSLYTINIGDKFKFTINCTTNYRFYDTFLFEMIHCINFIISDWELPRGTALIDMQHRKIKSYRGQGILFGNVLELRNRDVN